MFNQKNVSIYINSNFAIKYIFNKKYLSTFLEINMKYVGIKEIITINIKQQVLYFLTSNCSNWAKLSVI